MVQETKQKVMAGVLATLVLGMGGYWVAFADGNKSGEAVAEGVTGAPMVRAVAADTPKGRDKVRKNVTEISEKRQPAERPTVEDRNDEPKPKRPTESGKRNGKKPPPSGC